MSRRITDEAKTKSRRAARMSFLAVRTTAEAVGYAVEHRLWQSWLTLVAFLVLLTVEWVVRKWAGLP